MVMDIPLSLGQADRVVQALVKKNNSCDMRLTYK